MKALGGLGIFPARRLCHAFCFFSRGLVNSWGNNISLLEPAAVVTGGGNSTRYRALPNSEGDPTVQ